MNCPFCGSGALDERGLCSNPLCDQGPLIASDEAADAMREAMRVERILQDIEMLDDEDEEEPWKG